MNRALICLIGLSGLTHCQNSDDGDSESSRRELLPPDGDASMMAGSGGTNNATPNMGFQADWCTRLGSTETERLEAADIIVFNYVTAHSGDCETAGLSALIEDQFEVWIQYLNDYTFLLAGCSPNFGTVAGGIAVFGPANTPFVGVARSPLSEREAALLVDFYVTAFAGGLRLSASERESVQAHLAQVVSNEVDGAALGSLSTCLSADAGSGPAGAGND